MPVETPPTVSVWTVPVGSPSTVTVEKIFEADRIEIPPTYTVEKQFGAVPVNESQAETVEKRFEADPAGFPPTGTVEKGFGTDTVLISV